MTAINTELVHTNIQNRERHFLSGNDGPMKPSNIQQART